MSDRASGHPGRSRLAARVALLLGPRRPGRRTRSPPLAAAAAALTVTTPFPAVVAEPGSTASFKLADRRATAAATSTSRRTACPTAGPRASAAAASTIDGAYVDPEHAARRHARRRDPRRRGRRARPTIRVVATGPAAAPTRLPLTIRVADAAAGRRDADLRLPRAQGRRRRPRFTFNVTLHNDTAAETDVLDRTRPGPAAGPSTAKPSGQAQATTLTVAAGGTGTITVTAKAAGRRGRRRPTRSTSPSPAAARTPSLDLAVTVTGTYTLDALDARPGASRRRPTPAAPKDFQLTLTNTGTAPITGVTPSAERPDGLEGRRSTPTTIASIDARRHRSTVTAQITPSSRRDRRRLRDDDDREGRRGQRRRHDPRPRRDARSSGGSSASALIVAVFAGLYWVFRTYGRR